VKLSSKTDSVENQKALLQKEIDSATLLFNGNMTMLKVEAPVQSTTIDAASTAVTVTGDMATFQTDLTKVYP